MMNPFLGKTFVPFELRHRDLLAPQLAANPQSISGYTFAMLAAWNDVFHYAWCQWDPKTLLIAATHHDPPELLMPVGELSPESERRLLDEICKLPRPLHFVGVTPEFLERHPAFASHFDAQDEPGGANYVYLASDLADLPGRKYHKKRNLIAQAERAYRWTVEPLTAEGAAHCRAVMAQMPPPEGNVSKLQELTALSAVLDHFAELGLEGLVLRVEGQPVAFSIFERLGADTAVVHFEKATGLKGLYQVINHETSQLLHRQGYTFINREEDANDEGLRQAKASYLPVQMRHQWTLTARVQPADWAGRTAVGCRSGARECRASP